MTDEEHPDQRTHSPRIPCSMHPDGCGTSMFSNLGKAELRLVGDNLKNEVRDSSYMVTGIRVSMAGKVELRMVNVDASGFKGEHTGREKLKCPEGPHSALECVLVKEERSECGRVRVISEKELLEEVHIGEECGLANLDPAPPADPNEDPGWWI